MDYTAQLPEEILEDIIRESGPRFSTAASENGFPDKANWLSCSSVCHRWHRIAMPYAFRYVRVRPSDDLMDITEDGAASRFELFLHENPSIASLIEEVNLTRVLVDIKGLRNILVTLINLRCLVFHRSFIEGPMDLTVPPTTCKVNKLMYTGGGCELYNDSSSVCKWQIPALLRSFSVIDEFEELGGCDHVDSHTGPLDELGGEDSQIHSLSTLITPHSFPHIDAFHQLRSFSRLSCLRLTIDIPLQMAGEAVSVFLESVGGSLHELALNIGEVTCTPFSMSPRPSEEASSLRKGIAACHSLHGFRLEIRHTNFNCLVDEEHIRETFAFGTGVGVEIISFLHSTELAHLSFCYRPSFTERGSLELEDVRDIDFSMFCDIHRRFVDLRSLTLDIYNDSQGPEDPHLRAELIACVRNRLEGFNGVLYHNEPGAFFRCDEPSCPWTSKGKLNKYMTLHREVFRNYWE